MALVAGRGGLFSGVGKGRRTREGPPGVFAFRQHPKDARASGQEPETGVERPRAFQGNREAARTLADKAAQQLLERMDHTVTLPDDFPETVRRVVQILGELGVRAHITGGIAVTFYGDPRYTQDLDFVVDLTLNRPETALCWIVFPPGMYLTGTWRRTRSRTRTISGDRSTVDDQD